VPRLNLENAPLSVDRRGASLRNPVNVVLEVNDSDARDSGQERGGAEPAERYNKCLGGRAPRHWRGGYDLPRFWSGRVV